MGPGSRLCLPVLPAVAQSESYRFIGILFLFTTGGDNKDRKLLYAQRMRTGFMRSSGLGQFTPKRPDYGGPGPGSNV